VALAALQLVDLELLLVALVVELDTHLAPVPEQPDRVMLVVELAALPMAVVAVVVPLKRVVRFTTMEPSAVALAEMAHQPTLLGGLPRVLGTMFLALAGMLAVAKAKVKVTLRNVVAMAVEAP
jgi:hypothetical protein